MQQPTALTKQRISDDWTLLYYQALAELNDKGIIVSIGSNGSTKLNPAIGALEKCSKFIIKIEELRIAAQEGQMDLLEEFHLD